MMGKISANQKHLEEVTALAIDGLTEKNENLIDQQKQMLLVSQAHRSAVESNLHDLMREKGLIKAGQMEVADMIAHLKAKLDESLSNLKQQSKEAKQNHATLTKDLGDLHESTFKISDKISETTEYILSQNEIAAGQFEDTLNQLGDINDTITKLAKLLRSFETDLDTKLAWISERVGGTDAFINNIGKILNYLVYLLLGMLILVFVNAPIFYRMVFVAVVPANLACSLFETRHLDLVQISQVLLAVFAGKFLSTFSNRNRLNILNR